MTTPNQQRPSTLAAIRRAHELYYEGTLRDSQLAAGWTSIGGITTIRHSPKQPPSAGPGDQYQYQRESTRRAAARARQLCREMTAQNGARRYTKIGDLITIKK
ncbi:hypothetical protein SeMB42_g01829 [Synchytrium endobioticum]|uniref:Uncharacterized protein n=1 Tax=Synchytrium endobioticum TaxID=286115 RepID=A0A507DCH3_9FUNG|nr:hypothetical protein SeLEV6574_g01530 [Synchytrium endobioticum]TPX51781.1 hypothetical protein SeMB42_g01829 [Synchytrium endobioticum]